jgi:UDP-N-acetylmuramoylalanine--D-glutamate ligase
VSRSGSARAAGGKEESKRGLGETLFRPGAGEVAVIGLARSGRAVAKLLASRGARVYASDSGDAAALAAVSAELRGLGIAVDAGRHDLERIARSAAVVVSPGVPPDAAPLAAARRSGVPIVSEIEVALWSLPGQRYVAITGTNGKTTTTALTAKLLEALGVNAVAAGNIGTPLSEVALAPDRPDWIALEVSSFQLHDSPSIAPTVGMLTNLSANHLDRYTSIEDYYGDKALLFQNASAGSVSISNRDDPDARRMVEAIPGHHFWFSVREKADAWLDPASGALTVLGHPVLRREELPLLGDHNVANALAAALAVMLGDPAHQTLDAIERIAGAMRRFDALEHRIETVAERDGVTWINDSKSTNVASTLVALKGMRRPTILLLGGRHKGEPYTELVEEIRRTVREVIAYGEAAPIIAGDLDGIVPVSRLGSSFADVISAARAVARPGDVVLLSPACSSYDMFDNYEQRGRTFKEAVRGL